MNKIYIKMVVFGAASVFTACSTTNSIPISESTLGLHLPYSDAQPVGFLFSLSETQLKRTLSESVCNSLNFSIQAKNQNGGLIVASTGNMTFDTSRKSCIGKSDLTLSHQEILFSANVFEGKNTPESLLYTGERVAIITELTEVIVIVLTPVVRETDTSVIDTEDDGDDIVDEENGNSDEDTESDSEKEDNSTDILLLIDDQNIIDLRFKEFRDQLVILDLWLVDSGMSRTEVCRIQFFDLEEAEKNEFGIGNQSLVYGSDRIYCDIFSGRSKNDRKVPLSLNSEVIEGGRSYIVKFYYYDIAGVDHEVTILFVAEIDESPIKAEERDPQQEQNKLDAIDTLIDVTYKKDGASNGDDQLVVDMKNIDFKLGTTCELGVFTKERYLSDSFNDDFDGILNYDKMTCEYYQSINSDLELNIQSDLNLKIGDDYIVYFEFTNGNGIREFTYSEFIAKEQSQTRQLCLSAACLAQRTIF